jgi:SAM-dependent methyltransferase
MRILALGKRFNGDSHPVQRIKGMTMPNPEGPVAPDGSPVELFARLPAGSAPQLIHDAVPLGATILELGAGAGRITHPLIGMGHDVIAVDESPDMLAHINGAEKIECRIEDLALGRRFDVVLLMSHLIENPDHEVRRGLLKTCRTHVADHGYVLIQRDPPDRNYNAEPLRRTMPDGSTIGMRDLNEISPGVVSFTLDYHVDGSTWSQSVVTRRISDRSLESELSSADLEIDSFITPNRTWLRARPCRRGEPSGSVAPA